MANLNNSSTTLTALFTLLLLKKLRGNVVDTLQQPNASTTRELTCFKKLSQKHKFMLAFDFNRKTHTLFMNYIFVHSICYFLHTDITSTSIFRRIEADVESIFHFGPPIDVFDNFNAINNTKM